MLKSECCGADVDEDVPLCSDCKEWCDTYDEDEEEDDHKLHCKKNQKWSEFLTFIKWCKLKCTCSKYDNEEESNVS